MNKVHWLAAASSALVLALPAFASAQIAVSAHDGKQLRPGEAPSTRTADHVAVIDLSGRAPHVVGTVAAPTSMIGPPTSVAIAADASFAIVTSAQAIDGGVLVKNDEISVIDLDNPAAPRLVQTLHGGAGATGIAINRAGTLALVANTGDDAISVFTIAGQQLTPAGQVRLEYQSRPTDVAFAPDGSFALVVEQNGDRIVRLAVDGANVTRTQHQYTPGASPYGVVVSPDGRFAYNTNLGGRIRPADAAGPGAGGGATIGTISVADLTTHEVVAQVDVGMTPEHVALSTDGRYLAVVVANGSAAPPTSPNFHEYGLLQIYRVDGATLTPAGEAHTGKWCQGAVFNRDNTRVLLQCAMTKQVEVYRYDGRRLTPDAAATLTFNARPGAIAASAGR